MEPLIAHKWKRLDDLPQNWQDLCREDLTAVQKQWKEDRDLIRDDTKIQKIREKLALHWAIETGIIERLYKADRGITVQILEAGMEALGKFHAQGRISKEARALITDQRAAIQMVMDLVGGRCALSDSYIKRLHHCLTLSQETCPAEDPDGNRTSVELLKGQWKKQPNNPTRPDGSIHEYCPPDFVQDEIDNLLKLHEKHTHDHVCPEVEAAWLHHRFTQIHPFQDGNGRVARALTSAIFLKADCLVLVVRDAEHRDRYLDALEASDRGNLKPLVDLFADIQIGDLNEAIHSVREIRGQPIVSLAETIAERALRRKVASQEQTNEVTKHLIDVAHTRLNEVAGELERAFKDKDVSSLDARVQTNEQDQQDWWSWQIIEAAKKQKYYADLKQSRRWVSLSLKRPDFDDVVTKFVISLHAVGRAADLHAAAAFLTWPLEHEDESGSRSWHCDVVAEPRFRVRAETVKVEAAENNFRDWLERVIESGLSVWGENV